ncbi:putative chromatin remodeling complex subunit [Phaeomoniella chlamydospora]|uniref:Putative chromatin remodeling complex subunit n=1 Tax=Phaeomoniella chlamydospora TaxID=158046 RepID=A0A0G2EBX4_PHACM|nr:putative chromatin remodeling complex subunit [Phaeomoniella chlamydospora]
MPPFKDEHVLVTYALQIIAPGSETTLAQLGLPETFTPAQWRFPTRMFPATKENEWEPHRIREKKSPAATNGTSNGATAPQPETDVEMKDQSAADGSESKPEVPAEAADETATVTYEEEPESTESAVYPIREGRIENWSCFLALVTHIYNTLSPPFHTPILVVSQPCWSARDHEIITQFFFENFKIPAFCLIDAALATCYAYGVPSATVVDVGHSKCDVTAVSEFVPQEAGRGVAVKRCGGDALTLRLLELLERKGFNYEMCEQLKKSSICEILPLGVPMPGEEQTNGTTTVEANPAAAASTGAASSGPGALEADGKPVGQAPRGPGVGTEVGEPRGEDEENEGVLDVASIVARGDTSEFLAKREKERAEKAAIKKAGAAAEAARTIRMKNSEKPKATFQYEEHVPADESVPDGPLKKRKRDIEVGLERFLAATPKSESDLGIFDIIAATIHNTIQAVDGSKRSDLWENLIIVGNGSRLRGFKDSLLQILTTRYTLSPSSATMFTSELPSNLSTPLPTGGTNTPMGQGTPVHHPAAHGVNPLLVAATHANQPTPPSTFQTPHIESFDQRHGHSQTPTSIKTVKGPEYFPEWKDANYSGMEEASFLGAQVAAKVIFVVDQGVSKGFFTRSEYNDMGPAGIHEYAM